MIFFDFFGRKSQFLMYIISSAFTEYGWKIQLNSLNIHFNAFPISLSVGLDSIPCASTQSTISAAEYAFPSEIAITQSSDTALATSKHCWGYREANDAALISQVFVNQILAVTSARPKSLISANGNSMFFGCAWNRTTDSILWSWKRCHQNGLQKQKCSFRSL